MCSTGIPYLQYAACIQLSQLEKAVLTSPTFCDASPTMSRLWAWATRFLASTSVIASQVVGRRLRAIATSTEGIVASLGGSDGGNEAIRSNRGVRREVVHSSKLRRSRWIIPISWWSQRRSSAVGGAQVDWAASRDTEGRTVLSARARKQVSGSETEREPRQCKVRVRCSNDLRRVIIVEMRASPEYQLSRRCGRAKEPAKAV